MVRIVIHQARRVPPSSPAIRAMADSRELQDRTRGRQGHDDHHEHGLRKIDPLGDVIMKGRPVIKKENGTGEGRGPQTENHFDLSQKMEHFRTDVHRMAIDKSVFNPHLVRMLPAVGHLQKTAGQKGMQYGSKKDGRCHQIEGVYADTVEENGAKSVDMVITINCLCFLEIQEYRSKRRARFRRLTPGMPSTTKRLPPTQHVRWTISARWTLLAAIKWENDHTRDFFAVKAVPMSRPVYRRTDHQKTPAGGSIHGWRHAFNTGDPSIWWLLLPVGVDDILKYGHGGLGPHAGGCNDLLVTPFHVAGRVNPWDIGTVLGNRGRYNPLR